MSERRGCTATIIACAVAFSAGYACGKTIELKREVDQLTERVYELEQWQAAHTVAIDEGEQEKSE